MADAVFDAEHAGVCVVAKVVRLPTGYEPDLQERERPVSKQQLAEYLGVSTRTIDRWIERRGMPRDTQEEWGCWFQAGGHRRFFPSRVRSWLDGLPVLLPLGVLHLLVHQL